MLRSEDRILTTHVGSLPRPDDLVQLNAEAVQAISNGEFGKATRAAIDYGAWQSYAYERLTG